MDSTSTANRQPKAFPLSPVYPETGRSRPCHNPPCENMIGGGKTRPWLLCSACRATAYCSKECQKANWREHKPYCKATVAERDEMKSAQALLTSMGGPIVAHPERDLASAFFDAYTTIASHAIKLAARSAFRMDFPDTLVYTHFLEVTMEWQGAPKVVNFKDPAAVIQQYKMIEAKLVKVDTREDMKDSFEEMLEKFKYRYGFVVIAIRQDRAGKVIGPPGGSQVEPHIHPLIFKNRYNRPMKLDKNWSVNLRRRLAYPAKFWSQPDETISAMLVGEDLQTCEEKQVGIEYGEYLNKNQAEVKAFARRAPPPPPPRNA